MKDIDLQRILLECLPADVLNSKGQILYSGMDTMRPARFYFVGFNPAKDDSNLSLRNVPLNRKCWSAYTQQCWYHANCDQIICPDFTMRPHQRRVQSIMRELRVQPEQTFATNLIFVESYSAKEIYDPALFDACWRVHKKMLAVVRPQFIICLGNGERLSAFSLVRSKADRSVEEGKHQKFKRFLGVFAMDDGLELTITVVGVRHPSYPMSPDGLREWLRVIG